MMMKSKISSLQTLIPNIVLVILLVFLTFGSCHLDFLDESCFCKTLKGQRSPFLQPEFGLLEKLRYVLKIS